jgi:adenylate cyclase
MSAFKTNIPLVLKLSVMISLLVIAGVSVVSVTLLSKQSQLQYTQVTDLGEAMAKQLANSVTEPLFTDDSLSLQLMVNNFAELPRVKAAAVFNQQSQLLTTEGNGQAITAMEQLLPLEQYSEITKSLYLPNGQLLVVSPIRFQGVTGGYVIILVDTSSLFASYTGILKLVLWVSALVAGGGLIAAYFIGRHVSEPIKQLLDATSRIQAGGLTTRIEERRNDELGRLIDAFNSMGDGLYRKAQVESLLGQFLARDVASQVLDGLDTVTVGGERVNASVLFVDIVGFTGMSEQLSPEQVAELLNEYFSYFTVCANKYFGTIDKFIGDCAMVIFGAPRVTEHHAFNAVACAVLMQKLNRTINRQRQGQRGQIQLRIGINSGPMLAGLLGTEKRMEYTVVGDSVNLASRLCHEAEPGEIVISHEVEALLQQGNFASTHEHKCIRVRGKTNPVSTFIVDDVARAYQQSMDDLIHDVLSSKAT